MPQIRVKQEVTFPPPAHFEDDCFFEGLGFDILRVSRRRCVRVRVDSQRW